MVRLLAAVVALGLATPAFAETPGKGDWGIGVSLGGAAGFANYGSLEITNGLSASYFITRELSVSATLGLSTTDKVGTTFGLTAGCWYYFMRSQGHQLSPFVGGAAGIALVSPSGADTAVAGLFLVGGGLEYFVNQYFGIRVSEGFEFITKPVTFALVTRLALTLYI
jgi:hypothetical protein